MDAKLVITCGKEKNKFANSVALGNVVFRKKCRMSCCRDEKPNKSAIDGEGESIRERKKSPHRMTSPKSDAAEESEKFQSEIEKVWTTLMDDPSNRRVSTTVKNTYYTLKNTHTNSKRNQVIHTDGNSENEGTKKMTIKILNR